MPAPKTTFDEAYTRWDRTASEQFLAEGDAERAHFLARFPRERWPALALEEYAVGVPDSSENYCRWIEFKTTHLGGFGGGYSRNLIIYKHAHKEGWHYDHARYASEQEAWRDVRASFIQAFEHAERGEYERIGQLEALSAGPALVCKSVYMYFPERFLPIYSGPHLEHFIELLGATPASTRVEMNRRLLDLVTARPNSVGGTTGRSCSSSMSGPIQGRPGAS